MNLGGINFSNVNSPFNQEKIEQRKRLDKLESAFSSLEFESPNKNQFNNNMGMRNQMMGQYNMNPEMMRRMNMNPQMMMMQNNNMGMNNLSRSMNLGMNNMGMNNMNNMNNMGMSNLNMSINNFGMNNMNSNNRPDPFANLFGQSQGNNNINNPQGNVNNNPFNFI